MISNLFHPTHSIKRNSEDNLFSNIFGHDNLKQIVQLALRADRPVHVLLTGEI
jgi:hypothetical protein